MPFDAIVMIYGAFQIGKLVVLAASLLLGTTSMTSIRIITALASNESSHVC